MYNTRRCVEIELTSGSSDAARHAVLGTLANGVRVLEALAGQRLTLRQLAAAVGLPRQTTYRLVHTLCSVGWAERDPKSDTYGLTSELWALGIRSFTKTDLRDALSPIVRDLADRYGDTVHLSVYELGSAVYIDKSDGWQPIRSYTALGGRAPAYCVATGKVLLAYQPPSERTRVLQGELVRFTPLTRTDPQELSRELDQILEQGFACNEGEWREGVGGVAIPVRSLLGDVTAALGFSGPVDRILQRRVELVQALQEALRQTSYSYESVRDAQSQSLASGASPAAIRQPDQAQ